MTAQKLDLGKIADEAFEHAKKPLKPGDIIDIATTQLGYTFANANARAAMRNTLARKAKKGEKYKLLADGYFEVLVVEPKQEEKEVITIVPPATDANKPNQDEQPSAKESKPAAKQESPDDALLPPQGVSNPSDVMPAVEEFKARLLSGEVSKPNAYIDGRAIMLEYVADSKTVREIFVNESAKLSEQALVEAVDAINTILQQAVEESTESNTSNADEKPTDIDRGSAEQTMAELVQQAAEQNVSGTVSTVPVLAAKGDALVITYPGSPEPDTVTGIIAKDIGLTRQQLEQANADIARMIRESDSRESDTRTAALRQVLATCDRTGLSAEAVIDRYMAGEQFSEIKA